MPTRPPNPNNPAFVNAHAEQSIDAPPAPHPPLDQGARRARKHGLRKGIIAIGLLLLIGTSVAGGIMYINRTPATPIEHADIGECVTNPSGTSPRQVSCSRNDAAYQVTGRAASTEDCATIAGTEAAYINEDAYLCLAPADFDQSREVNTIVADDCLIFEDIPEEKKETMATPWIKKPWEEQKEAVRSDCISGSYPVLAVINGIRQSRMDGKACTDAGVEADSVYGLSLARFHTPDHKPSPAELMRSTPYDLAFCMGKQNS